MYLLISKCIIHDNYPFYCDDHDGDRKLNDDGGDDGGNYDDDDDIDNDHDHDDISILFLRRPVSLRRTSLATIWFLKMIVSLW
jgi:hypothetical protein